MNKVAQQLQKALTEKGFALLVNHGIQEEKVRLLLKQLLLFITRDCIVRLMQIAYYMTLNDDITISNVLTKTSQHYVIVIDIKKEERIVHRF